MRALLQRVKESSVVVESETIGKIDKGILVFVGFTEDDSVKEIEYIANKIVNLRIFDDENGVMNKSLLDTNGSILSVSQFTLYANTDKGRRPSYIEALNPEEADRLYELFNEELRKYTKVETGKFQAEMEVRILNDGPVTIFIEK